MLRHILAPHVPAFARALEIPRTLGELSAAGFAGAPPPASGPAAVAITFDDGPHPDGTPQILEILAASGSGVKATFFLVGEQVVKRPELARRIAAEGHAIGLHGYRHLPHPSRTATKMREDFRRGAAAIADAVGRQPRLHRPPYGVYSPASLRIAREELGLQPLLWARWGKDWRKWTTPGAIARRVIEDGVRAGDVILLHDADFYSARGSHRRTAAALPEILKKLQSAEVGTVACA